MSTSIQKHSTPSTSTQQQSAEQGLLLPDTILPVSCLLVFLLRNFRPCALLPHRDHHCYQLSKNPTLNQLMAPSAQTQRASFGVLTPRSALKNDRMNDTHFIKNFSSVCHSTRSSSNALTFPRTKYNNKSSHAPRSNNNAEQIITVVTLH